MKKLFYEGKPLQHHFFLILMIVILGACTHQENKGSSTFIQRYRIVFENDIVGHITLEKQLLPSIQRSIETLEMHTKFRGMNTIVNRVTETHEEDMQGQALRFSKHIAIPNAERYISGEIHGSELTLRDKRGDKEQILQRTIPSNFLLHEGLREKLRAITQSTKTLTYKKWDYDEQQFKNVHVQLIADESIPTAWKLIQKNEQNADVNEQLVDQDFLPIAASFNYFGKHLLLERCTDHCRNDTITALRPLDQQILPSPYQVTGAALKGHIRYQLYMNTARIPPTTGEQLVHKTDTAWTIDVCAHCEPPKSSTPPDLAQYLSANTWMEITDPRLIAVVANTVKTVDSPAIKMKKLAIFTRKRLEKNPQFSGYATALQAYESRTGDCTEYAVLLAALGRAAQVPTRVVFGLSYSREKFHGKRNVFVPHAWVQAWVDGRWRSYDAALEVFDAGHIALQLSDGRQQDFGAMFENFEQMNIISMQHIVKSTSLKAEQQQRKNR